MVDKTLQVLKDGKEIKCQNKHFTYYVVKRDLLLLFLFSFSFYFVSYAACFYNTDFTHFIALRVRSLNLKWTKWLGLGLG